MTSENEKKYTVSDQNVFNEQAFVKDKWIEDQYM